MKEKNNLKKIRSRIPYGTMSIDFYDMSSIAKSTGDFEDTIDKRISKLKRQGAEIGNYSGYFDNVTDEYITKLLGTLETEHSNKKNIIKNLFRRRASDKIELEKYLVNIREEIKSTEIEYEYLKKIYDESNPLENGMLKIQKQNNDGSKNEGEIEENGDK